MKTQKRERPRPEPMTPLHKVGVGVAGLLTFAGLLTWIIIIVRQDGQIPVHFGADGQPDRWGSALEGWLVIILMVAAIITMLALTWFPRISNLPVEPVSDKGWQKAYSQVRWMLIAIALTCAGFIFIYTLSITGMNVSVWMAIFAIVSIGAPIIGIVALVRSANADRRNHAA